MRNYIKKIVLLCFSVSLLSGVIVSEVRTLDQAKEPQKTVIVEGETVSKAGTYFIKIYTDDENFDYARVHVRYPKTILDYNKEEGIDAHDVVIKKGTVDTYQENEWIQKTGVHAWSLDDGSERPITRTEIKKAKTGTAATQTLEFFTSKDLSIDVSVYELDDIHLGLEEVYVNQNAVVHNRIETLSLVFISLVIIPILIYLGILLYINIMNRNVTKMLYGNQKL